MNGNTNPGEAKGQESIRICKVLRIEDLVGDLARMEGIEGSYSFKKIDSC